MEPISRGAKWRFHGRSTKGSFIVRAEVISLAAHSRLRLGAESYGRGRRSSHASAIHLLQLVYVSSLAGVRGTPAWRHSRSRGTNMASTPLPINPTHDGAGDIKDARSHAAASCPVNSAAKTSAGFRACANRGKFDDLPEGSEIQGGLRTKNLSLATDVSGRRERP